MGVVGSNRWPAHREYIFIEKISLTLQHIDVIQLQSFEASLHLSKNVLDQWDKSCLTGMRGGADFAAQSPLVNTSIIVWVFPLGEQWHAWLVVNFGENLSRDRHYRSNN